MALLVALRIFYILASAHIQEVGTHASFMISSFVKYKSGPANTNADA